MPENKQHCLHLMVLAFISSFINFMTFSVTQDYTAPSNDTDHAWKLYKESEQQTAIKETF
jgi:hypothetical protein